MSLTTGMAADEKDTVGTLLDQSVEQRAEGVFRNGYPCPPTSTGLSRVS